jgi:hypothetical protein
MPIPTKQHGVICRKTAMFIVTAVWHSDCMFLYIDLRCIDSYIECLHHRYVVHTTQDELSVTLRLHVSLYRSSMYRVFHITDTLYTPRKMNSVWHSDCMFPNIDLRCIDSYIECFTSQIRCTHHERWSDVKDYSPLFKTSALSSLKCDAAGEEQQLVTCSHKHWNSLPSHCVQHSDSRTVW